LYQLQFSNSKQGLSIFCLKNLTGDILEVQVHGHSQVREETFLCKNGHMAKWHHMEADRLGTLHSGIDAPVAPMKQFLNV
jgi:hypothetical protein